MKPEKRELLEVIRQEAGLMYISDIPLKLSIGSIWKIMRQIPEGTYSEKEWRNAVEYCIVRDFKHL